MHDRPEFDPVTPPAPALTAFLRVVSHSVSITIANLIDKSISTSTSTVPIRSLWAGRDSVITLLDDGQGMVIDKLTNAMRLAS